MVFPTPKTLWLLVSLAAAYVASDALLSARPRQAATLSRLAALDSCLVASNRAELLAARRTITYINRIVVSNHNQDDDLRVLRQAQHIQLVTQSLADNLRQLRQHWPTRNATAALTQLPEQLLRFADTLRQFAPTSPLLAHGGTAQVLAAPSFGAAAPTAQAMLSRLEAQVWQINADALQKQAEKVSSKCCFCFPRIAAWAIPASTTVAPGTPYAAKLLLTQTTPDNQLLMKANGQPVPVDQRTKHGLIRFRVPPARAGQPDTLRAQWQGQLIAQLNGLSDTTFTLTVPYLIVRHPQP